MKNQSMKIDVLTIFPEFFGQVFDFGIIRRAKLAGIVEINVHDIRELRDRQASRWSMTGRLAAATGWCLSPSRSLPRSKICRDERSRRISGGNASGAAFAAGKAVASRAVAKEFADDAEHIVLICGRYEGVDERVNEALVTGRDIDRRLCPIGRRTGGGRAGRRDRQALAGCTGQRNIGRERFVLGRLA